MAKVSKFRMTVGWLMLVVALAAVAISVFRPINTRILDVKVGTGPAVKAGDQVSVYLIGKLDNGTEFYNSTNEDQPREIPAGTGAVVKGLDAGFLGMKVGGIRQLDIPPDEGYGARGIPSLVPPNSRLHFEIRLIGIH